MQDFKINKLHGGFLRSIYCFQITTVVRAFVLVDIKNLVWLQLVLFILVVSCRMEDAFVFIYKQ